MLHQRRQRVTDRDEDGDEDGGEGGKKTRAMGLCQWVRFGIGSSRLRYTHMRSFKTQSNEYEIVIRLFIVFDLFI